MKASFTFSDRVKSFKFAFVGIFTMLKSQHNAWVHVFATFLVTVCGLFLRISSAEWCLLVLTMMAVWITESLNTALEFLADAVSPSFNPLIKQAKDVAAGAVLVAAIGSIIIGLIVFCPYFI